MEEKKKILIVEDEAAIAELEKDYLELSGFQVETEGDGEKGLKKALEGNYDPGFDASGKRRFLHYPGGEKQEGYPHPLGFCKKRRYR